MAMITSIFSRLSSAYRTGLVMAIVLLSISTAHASTALSPVILEITASDRTSFTIKNNYNRAVSYQLSLLAWDQGQGDDRLTPSDDLVISPPAFTLAPGASREVRIGYRQKQPRPAIERAFRVMVEELPDVTAGKNAAGVVQMTVKHLLPLYSLSSNPNASPDLSWSIQRDGQRLRIRAENRGDRRAFIRDIQVAPMSIGPTKSAAVLSAPRGRVVVLAKSSRSWTVPLDAGGTADQWAVTLTDQFGQSRQQTIRLSKP